MKRILFVDVRNATRSQIAEAWCNHIAGVDAKGFSCGTMPANTVDKRAVQVMREVGIDIRRAVPKNVNQQMVAQADIVVLMGKDIRPHAFSPTRIWDLQDPAGKSVDEVRILRDQIYQYVQELIAEIQMQDLENISTLSEWKSLMHCLSYS